MRKLLTFWCLSLFALGCPPSEPPSNEKPAMPIVATNEPISDGTFHAVMIEPRLIWNANTEPDLAGYKVYVGSEPRKYGAPVSVGLVTEWPLDGLGQGKFYIAMTAFDAAGNESAFSHEVIYTHIEGDERDTLALRDDRILRLLAVYEKRDTQGNPISPEIVLEWRQHSSSWNGQWAKLDTLPKNYMGGIYREYTQAGDTLKVNIPYLAFFNKDQNQNYYFNIDFRAKLINGDKESSYASPKRIFRIIEASATGQPGDVQLKVVE